jgi:CheY-like chemotaxis protein
VFDAFSQADSSTTRKYGGTGLGLAISKTLVELMGGHIWLESCLGEGTQFSFALPFDIIGVHDKQVVEGFDRSDYVIPQEFVGARVLVVEDNDINQFIASELLSEAGFLVSLAVNGKEAVDMATKNEYDMILMDEQMPEMDGFTATRIIRSDERLSKIPIIAMTANAMQGDRERSIQAGMVDHITKPLDAKVVLDTICLWLGRS